MAQLVSGLDAVYTRAKRSWQDTSAPPNVLIRHLGPGLTALALQRYVDVANQPYHRESMKGQTADIPNTQPLFHSAAPPLLSLSPDETGGEVVHRDSMKGQVSDVPNNLVLGLANINPAVGATRVMVINSVFNKHPTQETTIQRNPVLDIQIATAPFTPIAFEQNLKHDSLGGQYSRSGAVVVTGVPPAFNEIYTFVPRLKTAQEPFIFPNALLLNIVPPLAPFVQRQSEDLQWKAKAAQEPFVFPNILSVIAKPVEPFVQMQREDLQWRGHKTQETYDFPNAALIGNPPIFIPPFVQRQSEDLQWRGHKTQEHYDFPNIIIIEIPPSPPVTFFEVPYVLALTQTQATQVLNFYGFANVAIVFAYDTLSPPGIVIAQSPVPYTLWPQSSPVILTVSQGPYVPPAPPLPILKVTTRQFSLEEMVSREWGSSFRAPDHRIYQFTGRSFDSTDTGNTGIYQKGIENPPVPMPPFPGGNTPPPPVDTFFIIFNGSIWVDQFGNPITWQ